MPTVAATDRTANVVLPENRTIWAGVQGGGETPRPTLGQLWPRGSKS